MLSGIPGAEASNLVCLTDAAEVEDARLYELGIHLRGGGHFGPFSGWPLRLENFEPSSCNSEVQLTSWSLH